jgi:hypothetical protein
MKKIFFIGIYIFFYLNAFSQIKIIPSVVHVVWENSTKYGRYANISDEQIYDAIKYINTALRKRNSDTAEIIPVFKNIAADTEIELRLATKDPNGNPTNGITRTKSYRAQLIENNSKLDGWPREKYLNIWIVEGERTTGIANLYDKRPEFVSNLCDAKKDGILVRYDYFGETETSQASHRTLLVKSLGRLLNLKYVWGEWESYVFGSSCLFDDDVEDTPITNGNSNCSNSQPCTTGIVENYQNYMDYSSCTNMFTYGQKQRMHTCLNSPIAGRNMLVSTQNLIQTGVIDLMGDSNYYPSNNPLMKPIVTFHSDKRITKINQDVEFYSRISNSDVLNDSYLWEFEDGLPSTSIEKNPTVKFTDSGFKKARLKVTNQAGESVYEEPNFIFVDKLTADFTVPYSTDFKKEDVMFYWWNFNYENDSSYWTIQNTDVNNSNCLKLNNFKVNYADPCDIPNQTINIGIDHLISPSFNFSDGNKFLVSFKYAGAKYNLTDNTNLKIYITSPGFSNNQFMLLKTITKDSLFSAGHYTVDYSNPLENHWRQTSFVFTKNMNADNSNLRLIFEFEALARTNNVFIDDFRIDKVVGVEEINLEEELSIFPNPADNLLSFSSKNTIKSIKIIDSFGKEIICLKNPEKSIDVSSLALGLYYIQLESNDKVLCKKFVKQ